MQSSFSRRLSKTDAQNIAIGFLGFLGRESEHLSRFLALTGLDPAQLRANARKDEFLAALLDYLMADEALLLAYCANENVAPGSVAPARALLTSSNPDEIEGL